MHSLYIEKLHYMSSIRIVLFSICTFLALYLKPIEEKDKLMENKLMENKENNGAATAGARQACAACKHQRKRCKEDCALHAFFPASKNMQFQAVHRVFGVSNIQKLLKSLNTFDERQKAIESLIWEAECRQQNPVMGSYGEYLKITHELAKHQAQSRLTNQTCPKIRANNKPVIWNGSNGMVAGGGGLFEYNNTNNANYIQNNGNYIEEPVPFSYGSLIQAAEQEKRFQGRDGVAISVPNLLNPQEQYYYHPDQRTGGNEKVEEAFWQQ